MKKHPNQSWKKMADGGEVQGRFSADTYERARRFVESGQKADPPAEQKRAAPKVAKPTDTGDETSRLSRRAKVDTGPAKMDRSIPSADFDPGKDTTPRVGRAGQAKASFRDSDLMDNVGKGAAALGLGYAGGRAISGAARGAVESMGKRVAREAADDVTEAAGKRAMASRASRQTKPTKSAPRDLDEERMSGEGGAFARGGMVGWKKKC